MSNITDEMKDINNQEVCCKMKMLKENKSQGSDNIIIMLNIIMLNRCSANLSIPLCIIFNQSLLEGRLSQEWKDANVTPIHKQGSQSNVGSYHVLSALPASHVKFWKIQFNQEFLNICSRMS